MSMSVTNDQLFVFAVLGTALALFIWGRWRYDLVAVLALLTTTLAGIVPVGDAFSGFGHPAVITVAAVLIISRALRNSGIVDLVSQRLAAVGRRPTVQVASLSGLVALCSGFMNNVGALALMMPVALQAARKAGRTASQVLMPMSFASLLGGLLTLIGTPPNIIIATYREEVSGAPFAMFDFLPVGAGVAAIGLVFITLAGWRLIPQHHRRKAKSDLPFEIDDYLGEARVTKSSKVVGKRLSELEKIPGAEISVTNLLRDGRGRAPKGNEKLKAGDVLVLEGDPASIKTVVDKTELQLFGRNLAAMHADDIKVMEAVINPGSRLEGRTPAHTLAGRRGGVDLLAISRQSRPKRSLPSATRFRVGDVLLLQGDADTMTDTLASLGCLPLAGRDLAIGRRRQILLPVGLLAAAVALTAFGVVPVQIAFTGLAVLFVLLGFLSPRETYEAVDWSVIVLLGAFLPVGQALQETGGTALIAGRIVDTAGALPPVAILALLLVVCMWLSDVINNAAAAVVMAPIGFSMAETLGVNSDGFLMAVAVGASCAFLTPIGHKNNTLILGPGGYAFGDYWRMGLPLDGLVVAAATLLIPVVWPL